jgi:hypothetical protein
LSAARIGQSLEHFVFVSNHNAIMQLESCMSQVAAGVHHAPGVRMFHACAHGGHLAAH